NERRSQDRDATAPEDRQIPLLVHADAHRRQRVLEPWHGPGPREELAPTFGIVPGRPNDDEVECAPVDGRVVPRDPPRFQPSRLQCGVDERGLLALRERRARDKRDRQISQRPFSWTCLPSSSIRPPRRRSLTMSQWIELSF